MQRNLFIIFFIIILTSCTTFSQGFLKVKGKQIVNEN